MIAPIIRGRSLPHLRTLGAVEQWREQYGVLALTIAFDPNNGRPWHWQLDGGPRPLKADCFDLRSLTTDVEDALRRLGAPPAERTHKPMTEKILDVPFQHLHPSKTNPRKHGLLDGIDELAASVKAVGLLQPVVARPMPSKGPNDYEIVFGHRRREACFRADLQAVKCIIRDYDDDQVLEAQTVENLQRSDVHPLDEADGFALLLKRDYDLPKIAAKIGKSNAYVAQRLKLCALSKAARKALDEELVSLGVALEIAKLPTEKLQQDALGRVTAQGGRDGSGMMSVADARQTIESEVMRKLANAPFDVTDAKLVPKAGACATCPKRTGTQVELFPDASSPDLCTDPTCFRTKLDAQWKIAQAGAKAAGKAVLPESKAKGLFSSYDGRFSYSADWSPLAGEEYAAGRNVKVRSLFPKGELPAITVARNPHTGDIVELVPKKLVQAAIAKRNGSREREAGSGGKGSSPKATPQQKAANKRAALLALAKARAGSLAIEALVAQVEEMDPLTWMKKLLPPIAAALIELCYDGAERVAGRRVPPDPKKVKQAKGHARYGASGGDPKALGKLLDEWDDERKIRGLVTELVVSDLIDFDARFGGRPGPRAKLGENILKLARIDPKKFEAKALGLVTCEQAVAELAETEKKTKGKPGKKAKASPAPADVARDDEGLDDGVDVRTCRVCGCTDEEACEGGCEWIEADLCSNCAESAQKKKPARELVDLQPSARTKKKAKPKAKPKAAKKGGRK